MSIIRKNPNEIFYPNGKKPIVSVIKNEASPAVVLWRAPYEDFNEGSKVIVAENEEALFYKNGIVEAVFTAGEFTLSTGNYAFLSRIRNFVSGGISAYNCRIIYINKTHQLNNRWGTDGPIQVVDKIYNMPINLIARGSYSLQIDDSKKFYIKLAGSTASTMTAEDIASEMISPVNQKIKVTISKVIDELETEILGISSRLETIAESMREPMDVVLNEYGVRLVNFYIEAIEIVEDETYKILKDARAMAASRVIMARGAKAEVGVLGSDYGRVKTADIMMTAAQNPSGGVMGDGIGIGAGMAMGGIMASSAASVLSPLDSPKYHDEPEERENTDRFAPKTTDLIMAPCGHMVVPGAKFCSECGKPTIATCPHCGKPITPGAKFCSECGGSLI